MNNPDPLCFSDVVSATRFDNMMGVAVNGLKVDFKRRPLRDSPTSVLRFTAGPDGKYVSSLCADIVSRSLQTRCGREGHLWDSPPGSIREVPTPETRPAWDRFTEVDQMTVAQNIAGKRREGHMFRWCYRPVCQGIARLQSIDQRALLARTGAAGGSPPWLSVEG
jgi:hypothetical protein